MTVAKRRAVPRRPAPGPAADVDALQGLGPRSRVLLAGIGITSAAALKAQDPFAVYARLKAAEPTVSLNMLYGLIGAVEGRDWRTVARADRTAIVLRLQDMGLL